MVKLTGRKEGVILGNPEDIPIINQKLLDKIEGLKNKVKDLKAKNKKIDDEFNTLFEKTKREQKKEELNETEQIFLEKMFTAYLKQYPLISKGKNPDKYKANHKMGKSVGRKLVKIEILPEPDEKDKYA